MNECAWLTYHACATGHPLQDSTHTRQRRAGYAGRHSLTLHYLLSPNDDPTSHTHAQTGALVDAMGILSTSPAHEVCADPPYKGSI